MDSTDKIFIGFIILILAFFGVYIGTSTHFGESTEQVIQATVIEKEYVPRSTYIVTVPMGKRLMPQTRTRPEKFKVTVKWEGGIYTIDSESKFNTYEIGDSIPVTCVTWFRKDGTIKKKFIRA